ncbi:MAG: riboflavin biosynthesis protein RibF [Acidobacteriota bacterium]|nr:riboflavin biosynthesis protein RibF [Acidobacteriota bacterium]
MQIIDDLNKLPPGLPYPVATIGVFDGLHLGHQAIVRRVVQRAREVNGTGILLTFSPHPQKIISPADAPSLLQLPVQKHRLLEELGLDILVRYPFSRQVSRFSPERFVRDVLGSRGVKEIHVGSNFRFGYGRAGDFKTLESLGRKVGFHVFAIDSVRFRGRRVSSTVVRKHLGQGRVALCRRLLNRPYQILGTVVRGSGRGADLGFPTANLQPASELIPASGVYVTRATVNGAVFVGATNVGYRPTLGEPAAKPVVETYLLDADCDLYGESMALDFWFRLRSERRFSNLDALKRQLGSDVRLARKYGMKSDSVLDKRVL